MTEWTLVDQKTPENALATSSPEQYLAQADMWDQAANSNAVHIKKPQRIVGAAFFGGLYVIALGLTVLGTLFALSRDELRNTQALPVLQFNLIFLALLSVFIGLQVWAILFARRSLRSAPLLHRRFVIIFSLAALTPAMLVGAFSTTLISQNINEVLGKSTRVHMEEAREFLDSYLRDELNVLIKDTSTLELRLNITKNLLRKRITNTARLQIERSRLGLDAIYLMSRDGLVLMRAEGVKTPDLKIPVSSAFEAVKAGEIAVQPRDELDYLVALTGLENYPGVYLYAGRFLRSDSKVLSSISGIDATERTLETYIEDQQVTESVFLLTFFETVILILVAAIWLGIVLANRIIDPLSRLVEAAEQVRGGNLSARVSVEGDWGEMSDLGSAFNRMTRQLRNQREELVREHDISEQRRQFSEAVLSGVRAGVIGLTQEGRITLMNASAVRLLNMPSSAALGQPLEEILSEFAPAFKAAREDFESTSEDQVKFETLSGSRIFDLRVAAYLGARKDTGWVLTFDDMTRLVAAQRHSAWREVARRIAHEIKNPLTPIQLSAERLQRKYGREALKDSDVFENCTDTIIRQVGSLERMVDEFSAFARMPAPVFTALNINDIISEIMFEQGVAFPGVEFTFDAGAPVVVMCDARLISQALTNITKNAAESIGRRIDETGLENEDGKIVVSITPEDEFYHISIRDNGMGWPMADKERLLEPYVTTRDTGTGLGLAIVQRIAEDHGGYIRLSENVESGTGATLILALPVSETYSIDIMTEDTNAKLVTETVSPQSQDIEEDQTS
ncbi:MAG: ATP-binding protein [Maricaulaceae bacterium]